MIYDKNSFKRKFSSPAALQSEIFFACGGPEIIIWRWFSSENKVRGVVFIGRKFIYCAYEPRTCIIFCRYFLCIYFSLFFDAGENNIFSALRTSSNHTNLIQNSTIASRPQGAKSKIRLSHITECWACITYVQQCKLGRSCAAWTKWSSSPDTI